jgi:beta-ribofuranosylaminobenzene 5'-phosphate synthase
MIEVIAGARIHISLADMGFASARAFGGVGFMIDRPKIRIHLQFSRSLEWHGFEALDETAQQECRSLGQGIVAKAETGAIIRLHEHTPQHVGLGSKTALRLSLIAGLHALLGIEADRALQQQLSGRGGGSGIGIHGFFEGGVLWDVGHPSGNVETLLPSNASSPHGIPPLMLRCPFQDCWRIGLCLSEGTPICGMEERAFFERETPVDASDALRAMAALYHGVLPAFRLADLNALRSALAALNAVGFKAREIAFRGEPVKSLVGALLDRGYAASMSSMGPLVYAIFEADAAEREEELRSICAHSGAKWLGVARGLNKSARLIRNTDR